MLLALLGIGERHPVITCREPPYQIRPSLEIFATWIRRDCGTHSRRSSGNTTTAALTTGCPTAFATAPASSAVREVNLSTPPVRFRPGSISISKSAASLSPNIAEASDQPAGRPFDLKPVHSWQETAQGEAPRCGIDANALGGSLGIGNH